MTGRGAARLGGPLRQVLSWWRLETLNQQHLERLFDCSSARGCPVERWPGLPFGAANVPVPLPWVYE